MTLTLIVCPLLVDEVRAAVAQLGEPAVQVHPMQATPGGPCTPPEGVGEPEARVCLAGACAAACGEAGVGWASCLEGVVDRWFVDTRRAAGDHLTTPAGLERLEAQAPAETRRLVLLDTGLNAETIPRAQAVAGRLALPLDVVPVGLDHTRAVVRAEIDAHQRRVMAQRWAVQQVTSELIGLLVGQRDRGRVEAEVSTFLRVALGAAVVRSQLRPRAVRAVAAPPFAEFDGGFRVRLATRSEDWGWVEASRFASEARRREALNVMLSVLPALTSVARALAARATPGSPAWDALAAAVLDTVGDGIVITDADNRILHVNPAVTRITGYAEAELVGRDPRVFGSDLQSPAFYQTMWDSLLGCGRWTGELLNRHRGGRICPQHLSLSLLRDAEGEITHHVAVIRDLTDARDTEAELEYRATHDTLTGLVNRDHLFSVLPGVIAKAARAGTQFAVVYLDLDQFNSINDAYGHLVGDAVLRAFAERLRARCGQDVLMARMGADEFVVILEGAGLSAALEIGARVVRLGRTPPIRVGDDDHVIDVSVGIAVYPAHGEDVETLMCHADAAMYHAKRRRLSRPLVWAWGLQRPEVQRRRVERMVRETLDADRLEVVFQPMVALATGTVIGAEALVRCRDANGKRVMPGAFVPFIEQSDLIIEVGDRVLDLALEAAAEWPVAPDGTPRKVAVNFAERQFTEGLDAVELLSRCAARGLLPSQLVVEIIERTLFNDSIQHRTLLARLAKAGVEVAVDDFGTGYSALAILDRFDVSTLKIDRSFVARLPGTPKVCALVRATIAMAHALGLSTVAEGIETEAQRRWLAEAGCEVGVGFLWSKGRPPEAFTRWLAAQDAAQTAR